MNPRTLDQIARRLLQNLPEGFAQLPEEIKRNMRSAVTAALARADLVTREEFDIQSAVLRRTREKLTALETAVRELEEALERGDRRPHGEPRSGGDGGG